MAKKKMQFEEALEKLEEIVNTLENEEVSLEKSIALYKEGMAVSAICQEKLALAKGEITQLQKENGVLIQKPFALEEEI